jgi:hypothetical protein
LIDDEQDGVYFPNQGVYFIADTYNGSSRNKNQRATRQVNEHPDGDIMKGQFFGKQFI